MPLDPAKRNLYLASSIILSGFLFMVITGFYIVENTENSNSREMAIDQRIDQCYEEEELN